MLGQKEMIEKVVPLMKTHGIFYKKCKSVFARRAKVGETIATRTKDGLETTNTAVEGDYIVKNQTEAEESYIMSRQKFSDRYIIHQEGSQDFVEYQPKGRIIGLELTDAVLKKLGLPAEFHFEASWGSAMIARKNDYLACPPGFGEVYRIARKEFFETYAKETSTDAA